MSVKKLRSSLLVRENRRLLLENKRLQEALLTDDLTGLFNARCLREQLEDKVQDSLARNLEPALLFIDVDFFKAINEVHGHEAAGRILSQVGCKIASVIRAGDIAFRYGGDEFVVLVTGGVQGARLVGERIRSRLEKHCFKVSGLQGAALVRLTVSAGAHLVRPGDRMSDILAEADRAMFEAKRKSRNRLVVNEKSL